MNQKDNNNDSTQPAKSPAKGKTKRQLAFIELRAQGLSYDQITKELGIAKSTCTSWNRKFKEEITELSDEMMQGLFDAYKIARKHRVKALQMTLGKIEQELEHADYSEVSTDKLMQYELRYLEALKKEYEDVGDLAADYHSSNDAEQSLVIFYGEDQLQD